MFYGPKEQDFHFQADCWPKSGRQAKNGRKNCINWILILKPCLTFVYLWRCCHVSPRATANCVAKTAKCCRRASQRKMWNSCLDFSKMLEFVQILNLCHQSSPKQQQSSVWSWNFLKLERCSRSSCKILNAKYPFARARKLVELKPWAQNFY